MEKDLGDAVARLRSLGISDTEILDTLLEGLEDALTDAARERIGGWVAAVTALEWLEDALTTPRAGDGLPRLGLAVEDGRERPAPPEVWGEEDYRRNAERLAREEEFELAIAVRDEALRRFGNVCGAPTRDGSPCRFPSSDGCPHHRAGS